MFKHEYLIRAAAESLNGEFIRHLIGSRTKFENWLQVEISKSLFEAKRVTDVNLEFAVENNQAVDLVLTTPDRIRKGVELKMYVSGKTPNKTSILNDIKKIEKLPNGGYIFFIYGYKSETALKLALARLESMCEGYVTIPFAGDGFDLRLVHIGTA